MLNLFRKKSRHLKLTMAYISEEIKIWSSNVLEELLIFILEYVFFFSVFIKLGLFCTMNYLLSLLNLGIFFTY
jgi:hypothetical protein